MQPTHILKKSLWAPRTTAKTVTVRIEKPKYKKLVPVNQHYSRWCYPKKESIIHHQTGMKTVLSDVRVGELYEVIR